MMRGLIVAAMVLAAGVPFALREHEAAPAPTGRGWVALAADGDGGPRRFDPCRAIIYRIRSAHAPVDGHATARRVFRQLGRLTGLAFRDGGMTDAVGFDDDDEQVIVIGWQGEPAWARHGFEDDVVGLASTFSSGGGDRIVGAVVWLRRDRLDRDGSGRWTGAVLRHELGHALGLDHVADERQVMFRSTLSPHDYAPGDRAGLAAVGRRATDRCTP